MSWVTYLQALQAAALVQLCWIFFVNLNRAFADSLHSDARYPTEIPQFVHVKSLTSGSGSLSSGNFLIDSTLGRDTVFGIYVEDEEDHLIKSIQFR